MGLLLDIEDARFVRFTDDDGSVVYYATYTAYNGRDILPQLIETDDFLRFRISTLNGCGVRNKGMAMFPRRLGLVFFASGQRGLASSARPACVSWLGVQRAWPSQVTG